MNVWAIGVRVMGAHVTGESDSFSGGVSSFEVINHSCWLFGGKTAHNLLFYSVSRTDSIVGIYVVNL